MNITFDTSSLDSYEQFLQVRKLPTYRFRGTEAVIPDEYAKLLGVDAAKQVDAVCDVHPKLFDYQRDIAKLAIQKRKYAIFADCGLGKTFMLLEFAKHAAKATGRKSLIVSPLMVVRQTIDEAKKFYGDAFEIGRI